MTTSVAMCTYNGARYLKQQLDSIASQTRQVNEVVVCDDCSKDRTCSIVEKFADSNPGIHVRLIKNETNVGFLRNFEHALSLCSGDLIFLSDQDDVWMEDKVEVFCNYFETHPDVNFAFSNAELINSIGVRSFNKTLFDVVGLDDYNKRLFRKGFALELLATSGRVTGCTSAVRASFVPYCIPFPYFHIKPIHDEVMAVRAASTNSIGLVDKCLIQYRQHEGQTVGISLLFRFPPSHWGLAPKIRTWNKSFIDPLDSESLHKQEFIESRFIWMRSWFGILKILRAYISGKYRMYYQNPCDAMMMDLKGLLSRRWKIICKMLLYGKFKLSFT